MLTARTYTTYRSLRWFILLVSLSLSSAIFGQTLLPISTPAATNDTLRICEQTIVTYQSLEFGFNNPIIIWSFPGGNPTSGGGNGPHNVNYITAGTYYASVTAVDGALIVSDTIWVIVSNNVPTVTYTPPSTNMCSSDAPFLLTGGSPAGGVYSGPGVTNNIFDPEAAGPGTHQICYTYTEPGGCSAQACANFTLTAGPDASISDQDPFTPFANCVAAGGSATYTLSIDNISTTLATNTSYYIDWGDGSAPYTGATLPNGTSHTYTALGNFTITVAVTSANGCSDTNTYNFFNGQNPNVGIGIGSSQGCIPFTLDVPILNTTNNPPGTTYEVEFGDGTVMIFNHPPPDTVSYTYTTTSCGTTDLLGNPNSYYVRIRATNPCGTTQALASPIEISQAPEIDLQANDSTVCVGQSVQLTDLSDSAFYVSGGNCSATYTRDWIVTPATGWTITGDNGPNPTVTFTDTGFYEVCVAIQHPCGNDTACIQICVGDDPDINVQTATNGTCAPMELTMWNNSQFFTSCFPTVSGFVVNGTDSAWSNINGTTLSGDSSIFRFDTSGTYTVSYYAVNDCDSVFWDTTVVVGAEPVVNMPADQLFCELDTINLNPSGGIPNNGAEVDLNNSNLIEYRWHIFPATGWSYTGGTGPNDLRPLVSFTDTGDYTVCLVVETECGIDSACRLISFRTGPSLDISPDTTICYNESAVLGVGVLLGNPPYTYQWETVPPSGFSATTDTIGLFNLTSTTTYQVTVTDSLGCTSDTTVTVTVNPEIIVDAGPDITVCARDSIDLLGTISGGTPPYSFYWSPGGILNDSTRLDPTVAGLFGDTTFVLFVTDSLGCTSSDTIDVSVYQPILYVDAGPDTIYCNTNVVETLQGYSPPGGTWTGTGVVAPDGFNPSVAGTGTHQLIYSFTDVNGCYDEDTVLITVIDPVPPVAGPDTIVCIDSDTIPLSGVPVGGVWTTNGPASILSGNQFIPNVVGTFDLYYTTGYGSCELSDTITITVNDRPDLGGPFTREICSGDSILFIPNSSVASSSIFWNLVQSGGITGADATGTGTIEDTLFNASNQIDTVVYELYAIGPNPTDCEGDTTTLTVIVYPIPNITNPIDSFEICSGDLFTFFPTADVAGTTFDYVTVSMDDSISGGSNGTGNIGDFLTNNFGPPGYVHYQIYAAGPAPTNCVGDTLDVYVLVNPLPVADAGPDLDYCSNDSVQLQANIPGTSTFTWTPTTGLSDPNAQQPFVTITNTGASAITLDYILTVTDTATGCVNTDTVTITINPLPPVDAGPNTAICIGDSITIGTSNNAAYTYQWFIPGNPVFATSGTVSVMPVITTTYRLIQTDTATSCLDSSDVTITVIAAPVAGFVASPDSGCAPLNVSFTDTSTVGVSHNWYVNGQLFSNQQNPNIILNNTSNDVDSIYTIQLIITSGSGCSDTTEQNIVVHPNPDASFNLPTPFCAPDSISASFTGGAQTGSTFQWGASSPSVQIFNGNDSLASFVFPDFQGTFDSTYTIWLVITSPNGCVDSTAQNVTVYARPTAGFSIPSNDCGPSSVTVSSIASGTAITYGYSVIPSTGVVISDPAAANPTITFPASTSDSVVYTVYQSVIDSRGCADYDSASFTIYPTPTAGFTTALSDSCSPFTVDFSNISTPNQTGMDTSSMTFSWVFGNGQVSSATNPTTTYTNNGTSDTSFVVRLIATNAFGCVDTVYDTITVHPDPIAQFSGSPLTVCAPFTIDSSVVNITLYPDANSQYIWQVVDPNTGTVLAGYNGPFALSHTLLNDGDTIIVRLITTSPFGCADDTAEVTFSTIEDPVAGFIATPDSGCAPLNVAITDTSTAGVSHEWYLDGVLVSNAQNPNLVLTNTSNAFDSTYTLQLIVTSGSGCSDTTEQNLVVWANPVASFLATEVCGGEATVFNDQSVGTQSIVAWAWDFGDSQTDTVQNPTHLYSSPGVYVASLTITDARGCTHTVSDTVIVRPRPVADFDANGTCGADTLCVNLPSTFFDLSTISPLGGNITAWEWDMNADGITDYSTDTAIHTFIDSGFVDVQLIVETEYGCRDTLVKTYYVQTPPNADFVLDTNYGCGPLQVNATNQSTGTITSHAWVVYAINDAGNRVILHTSNTSGSGNIPTFQPSNIRDTTYYIELTVGNCCGFDTITRTATVRSNPSAGILPDQFIGCSPMPVEFQLDGQVNGSPDYVVIHYGDGTIDTVYRTPLILPNGDTTFIWGAQTHQYTYAGPNLDTVYTVRQYVYNPCGIDSTSVNITVRRATVNAFIDASPRQGCAPLTVTFANASFRAQNFTWCLDYDTITGNCTQPAVGDTIVYTYNQPGTYTVALFANDNCTFDTTFVTIEVYETPNVQFTANDVCQGDSTTFVNNTVANSAFISSYSWDFGDGNTSFLVNPQHLYSNPGVYTVTLIVNTTDGCPDTAVQNVVVHPGPVVDFVPVDLCLNEQPFTFDNLTDTLQTPLSGTLWNFGDGNTSTDYEPTHSYAAPGVYDVTLVHTTSNGCIDSITYQAVINALPTAAFDTVKTSTGSCGAPQSFDFVNNSVGADRYLWDFDLANPGSLTDSVENPSFTFTNPGVYDIRLIVESNAGCTDTAFSQVIVSPYPTASFNVDTTYGCAPLTVAFTSSSSFNFPLGSIETYYWDFGDGTTATTQVGGVTHTYNDPGFYTVSLVVETSFGCTDTFTVTNLISVYPQPVADFTFQINSDGTVQFFNQSTLVDGNTTYRWDFGDGTASLEENPIHSYRGLRYERDLQFEVCLLVDNPYGCPDSICYSVELLAYRLEVPNAFAPDLLNVGDGNVFLPKGNNIAEYRLEVFDAYGNLVFETTELSSEEGIPTEPWNGTFMNEGTDELPSGAYVWKIQAVFIDGYIWPGKRYDDGRVLRFGTVTLIR
ncbi:PKD domain-containing protein [Phaeocystidibacter luteus]|uniref:PKD domain-containing protein n=1 Tax=Phaeocystidibacter luteus TaxID=911197 RepID=A0A6N6RLP6_9FLAO|nr:PKD domain-containing protein [Phaeocystidibacter luteus]KAB2814504.1 PKD domain-containing protein [Phaeocystidibacter luteus]